MLCVCVHCCLTGPAGHGAEDGPGSGSPDHHSGSDSPWPRGSKAQDCRAGGSGVRADKQEAGLPGAHATSAATVAGK